MAAESSVKVFRLGIGFALFNLVLAATGGALLRLAFVMELPWLEFKYLLHAHSHTAMLGWASIALFSLFIWRFSGSGQPSGKYLNIVLLLQMAVIGLAVSFTAQGYAFWSILWSSLYLIFSYILVYRILRNFKRSSSKGNAVLLARTALYFMLLSTVFVWAIGPVMAMGLRFSQFFYLLIQAFLHFQINGWFVFGVLALIFQMFESKGIHVHPLIFRRFYGFLLVATFLTYALAVAWADPETWVFILNSIGVVLQGVALVCLLMIIVPALRELKQKVMPMVYFLIALSVLSFILKVIIQSVVVLPFLATVAYTIRYFVIGFLHLILLGVVSLAILGFILDSGIINSGKHFLKGGIVLILIGFIGSEGLLFAQGTMAWATMGFIPQYYLLLFLFSSCLPVGAICVGVALAKSTKGLKGDPSLSGEKPAT